jgi:hypothetical protein
VPVEADSLTLRPIRLSDDGADDVMAWLSEQGLLLSRPNGEGWAGVICPNGAEHTDGNPEGRYMPANRAYCCLHSHCVDFDSRMFLQWVTDNGGPAHTPGLREELLAQAMDSALSKLTPTPEYPDAAAAVIAEVERKELGRIEKNEWWGRFAYIQIDDAFFDMQDRREISPATPSTPCFGTLTASQFTTPSAVLKPPRRLMSYAKPRAPRLWSVSPTPPVNRCWSPVTAWSTATAGAMPARSRWPVTCPNGWRTSSAWFPNGLSVSTC